MKLFKNIGKPGVALIVSLVLVTIAFLAETRCDTDNMGGAQVQVNEPLTLYFLDVGQADAAVIECGEQYMMIDGGNAADSSYVYSFLRNTLGISHIDYMVATHPHEDHIGGLSGALNACTVGALYSPVADYNSNAFRDMKKYADRQNLPITVLKESTSLNLGDAFVWLIPPPNEDLDNPNDMSIIVRIAHGPTTILFTGDAEWNEEHALIEREENLSSTILKVAHHGSDTSSSYVFLREVMPKYAIISVGENNTYGHPSEAVLSRLNDLGAQVYRTDLNGQIKVTCFPDGEIEVVTEKNAKAKPSVTALAPTTAAYIGNKNTKKFHLPTCPSVSDMKEKNKVQLNSRQEAIDRGYTPCQRCNP